MPETSTILVPVKLKKELDAFKDHKKETYTEVICKLIEIAKENEESDLELSEETLLAISEARNEAKKGKVFSSKQVRQELGL